MSSVFIVKAKKNITFTNIKPRAFTGFYCGLNSFSFQFERVRYKLVMEMATIANRISSWDGNWSSSTVLIWICNLSNIELNISPSFTFAISHWERAMGPANRLYQIAKRSFIKSDQARGTAYPGLFSGRAGRARLGWRRLGEPVRFTGVREQSFQLYYRIQWYWNGFDIECNWKRYQNKVSNVDSAIKGKYSLRVVTRFLLNDLKQHLKNST